MESTHIARGSGPGFLRLPERSWEYRLQRLTHLVVLHANEGGAVEHPSDMGGIGLSDAIEAIRADLVAARSAGEHAEVRFPVQKVTVQLQVVAAREGEGRAGFKVPFVNLELGGSGSISSEQTSTVTVEFGEPVDSGGAPVKVAGASSERKR